MVLLFDEIMLTQCQDQEKNEEEKKEYFDCEGESKYESKRSARPSSARRLREAVAAARGGDQSQAKVGAEFPQYHGYTKHLMLHIRIHAE